jgi:branched-chain amino acid transport system ATP-binding protein
VFLEGAGSVDGNGNGTTKKKTARTRSKASADGPPVLSTSGVTKRFGGVTAVDDVSFDLFPNQILGIIGPNGAGKTTLFDLISGFVIADFGVIELHGQEITGVTPDVRARGGLGRSFQDARLFPGLTVFETIALALERQVQVRDPVAAALNLPAVIDSERDIRERVDALIELMGLEAFRDKFISELSTGSRRIVDLACVLAHEPSVILFDEPSSGIAQRETEALGPLLVRIRDATEASLLVIEHDMPLITSISDELIAMDLGRIITRGLPKAVVNDPQVVASYLGDSEDVVYRSGARKKRTSNGRKKT